MNVAAAHADQAVAEIRAAIAAWYARDHRDFPWRRTRDPYAVLVSEVMLQQTQASRVADRFAPFLSLFSDVGALASASDAAVLASWSGLGYNRRALALKRAAGAIAERGWPASVVELERLPGVGPYTARAVASLAFGIPVGVVDTNVRRWLVRRFGLDPASASGTTAALQELADALATSVDAGTDAIATWTHASMELGGSVCLARRPRCAACPVATGCPSRGQSRRVPVPRQPAFQGSARACRGAVLRALADASGHALTRRRLARTLAADVRLATAPSAATLKVTLGHLETDGLLHLRGSVVRLGGKDVSGAATTIRG
jgi:A/G-specific adenine glycosylase